MCSRCALRLGLSSEVPSEPAAEPGTPEPGSKDKAKVPELPNDGCLTTAHRASLPMTAAATRLPDQMDNFDVSVGTVLEGKYRLVDELGRGSMGVVYLAEDLHLRRTVAVKFLLPELGRSRDCADRFRQEAVAMAAINDANVAQIFTFGEVSGTPYFAMEHLDGRTTQDLIDECRESGVFVPVRTAMDILWQVLSGLAEIHRSGAVHRDIKPANVMISGDPVKATIVDFGLVRDVRMMNDTVPMAGTPAYIAPELVEGKKDADRSLLVDIYSVGASAYELFTGTIPHMGDTWFDIVQKHVTDVPVAPSKRRPDLPRVVDHVILAAMAKDPAKRFQSCDDFLRELMIVEDWIEAEGMPEEESLETPARRSTRGPSPFGARRTPGRGSSGPGGGGGRLLVIDKDPEFRGLIRGTAKAAVPGCDVEAAEDGMMALGALDQFRPSVVLLDFGDDGSNGAEMAAAIRANPEHAGTRIVAVSPDRTPVDEEVLEWLGIDLSLTKPVEIDALAGFLRPLLERSPVGV